MAPQAYKTCPVCGASEALDAPNCGHCGHIYRTRFAPPPPHGTRMYGQSPGYPGVGYPPAPTNGLAIAGMVCGIISLVLFCAPYSQWPLSLVGLILSILGMRALYGRGMAIAGLVTSILALLWSSIVGLIWVSLLVAAMQATPSTSPPPSIPPPAGTESASSIRLLPTGADREITAAARPGD